MTISVGVYKIGTRSPDDVSGLRQLVEQGQIDPRDIVAVMGKTEGNGCTNDFTRGYAVSSLQSLLAPHHLVGDRGRPPIAYVMSGGTEGVLSPHLTVFTRRDDDDDDDDHDSGFLVADKAPVPDKTQPRRRLTAGVHHTRDLEPDQIGTHVMVQVVADGVRQAMQDARIADPADVHLVQIKCPLVRIVDREQQQQQRQQQPAQCSDKDESKPDVVLAVDSYKSMALSRGASALGVALALDELSPNDRRRVLSPDDDDDVVICQDYRLYSKVASTSAGSELKNCEIIVLGNSVHARGDFAIGHDVMEHALDTQAIVRAIRQAQQIIATNSNSIDNTTNNDKVDDPKVVNILCKAEACPTGHVLGCRHTMLDDADIAHTRMARAVVGAVVASVTQDPMVYVSGGAEHQGPVGGGPVAAIVAGRVAGTAHAAADAGRPDKEE